MRGTASGGGRRILLTGATSGIGLELARRYAPFHELVVTGRALSPALAQLCAEHPRTSFCAADQSDPAAAADAIEEAIAARGWKQVEHVILNAGTGFAIAPQRETADSIRKVLAVNLTANLVIAHRLFALLEEAGGSLTLIGSTARRGAGGFASYAAAKAGLHAAARALHEEWRGRVLVQAIHPGPTRTGMHEKAGHDPGRLAFLFADARGMAAMIDQAIGRRKPVATLSPLHYWSGGALFVRGIGQGGRGR